MTKRCEMCGRTESEAIADARTLGLYEELKVGVYTCCEIAEWADEQYLAWSEAISEHARYWDQSTHDTQLQSEAVLVPVRSRPRVPWFRSAA
jgi:hypothetical protein